MVEKVLIKLVGHPQRQDDDGRSAEKVEVDQHPVEKADFAHPVQRDEHRHNARYGARGTDSRHHAAGVENQVEAGGADPGEQIKGEVTPLAEGFLDHVTDDEKYRHIAEQVIEVGMQEHVPDQPSQCRLRRLEAEAVDDIGVLQTVKFVALSTPAGIVRVVRENDDPAAQLLHESGIAFHVHQHPWPAILLKRVRG